MSVYDKYSEAQIKELKNLFCRAYEKSGLYHRSAEVAGLTKADVGRLLKDDPDFVEDYEMAKEKFTEALENVAHTKALGGESDSLLQFLLRANKPEKYNPSVAMKVEPTVGSRVMLMFSGDELTEEEKGRLEFLNKDTLGDKNG